MSDLLKVKVGGSDYLCKWIKPNTVEIGGREYRTVKIGSQIWMAENLDYKWTGLDTGSTGNPSTPTAWYYNNDETTYGWNGYKCGLLYNWYAASYLESNKATLLPAGWHVPTDTELDALATAVGGASAAGTKLKASNVIWATSWGGTDDYGFAVLPAGYHNSRFYNITSSTELWSKSESGASTAYSRGFDTGTQMKWGNNFKVVALSIRLVKSIS